MEQTRRTFLYKLAGGIVAVCSAPLLTGCSGITRSRIDNGPFATADMLSGIDNKCAAILYYASLAPSGHNAQPWFVKLKSDTEWIVGADPRRRMPAVDPDNRETLLGIGAFLENLALAARAHGYEPDIEIIAKSTSDEMVARITLQEARPADYPLDRITKRRTVRKGQLSQELKHDDVQALLGASSGNAFYFPRTASKHAQCIEEAQVEAYRVQTYREDASKELKTWFRLSDRDAREYRDGLTPEGMEMTGMKGWYIRTFMSPDDMLSDFSKKMSIAMNEEFVRQGAGWFVITGNSGNAADIIEAGRKYERMALIAREHKIALAPVSQLLEEKTGREAFASRHGEQVMPLMVLRAGYLNIYPDPVSLRRPISWFAGEGENT